MNLFVNVLKAFGIAVGATLLLDFTSAVTSGIAENLAGSRYLLIGLTTDPFFFLGFRDLAAIKDFGSLGTSAAMLVWVCGFFFVPALVALYLPPKGCARLARAGLWLILTISLGLAFLNYRCALQTMN
jgi:hypothetical protein